MASIPPHLRSPSLCTGHGEGDEAFVHCPGLCKAELWGNLPNTHAGSAFLHPSCDLVEGTAVWVSRMAPDRILKRCGTVFPTTF